MNLKKYIMDYQQIIEDAFTEGVDAHTAATSFNGILGLKKKAKEYAQKQIKLLNLACVSNSLPFDKVDLLLKMQIEEVRKHVDTQARDEGAVRADFDKWIRESPILTMHRQ